jgi:hypothetical protein
MARSKVGNMVALSSYSRRISAQAERTKAKNAEREITFEIARDAFLDGRFDDGQRIIKDAPHGITRTQYKTIARLLVEQRNNAADALKLLTGIMGESNAKRELAPVPMAKVGDILVASWGYEQSNVDFYQVSAVVGKASVRIRKLTSKRVGGGTGYDLMVPGDAYVNDPPSYKAQDPGYGPEGTLHRIQKSDGNRYSVKISSYSWAYVWDGEPSHETASGYGH